MRMLLVAALLASSPALADQASADARSAAHRDWIASRVAATEKAAADHRALCARVGGVRVGFTVDGVLASCWGKPARVNTTVTAGHRHEQWVYAGGYVYLTNGRVTAIQTTR